MMIDPKAKLIDILGNAQEYLDLATYRFAASGSSMSGSWRSTFHVGCGCGDHGPRGNQI